MARKGPTDLVFQRLIHQHGGRLTRPRALVLQALRDEGHLGVEQIYERAQLRDPSISLSTVYRTMSLLKRLGLVRESHLDEEHHHYELADTQSHGHMVCTECGRVEELHPSQFAILREALAARFLAEPIMVEISGVCRTCQESPGEERRATDSHG